MWCSKFKYGFLLLIFVSINTSQSYDGYQGLGFDLHHRFSDPIKALFNGDDRVPEKGTIGYYKALVHRDRVFHGRRLAGEGNNESSSTLTFASGNTTFHIETLGFLYYANISIGTPASWYLVALDTGSHLFWLPCDCGSDCVRRIEISPNTELELNIYSLRTSITGDQLSCTSPFCQNSLSCAPTRVHCPYGVAYLSANTSSSGYLVEDLLHLTTNSNSSDFRSVRIPFGCGVVQTGAFLRSGAPNGLLGLTMDPISLPSILASQNHTSNSYSMCFTGEGRGTIIFGDRDSNEQGETPIHPDPLNLYNISITHITMGTNVSAINFTVIFDTGTSFTHLTEPAYSILSEKFNSQINDRRLQVDEDVPFEYCYLSNLSLEDMIIPTINLTMGGGDIYSVIDPVIVFPQEDGRNVYCLAVVRSGTDEFSIDIIGENFMTGYRIVFDHERMVIGWKDHDCGVVVPLSPRPPVYSPPRLGTLPRSSGASPGSSGARSAIEHSYFYICILLIHMIYVQLQDL